MFLDPEVPSSTSEIDFWTPTNVWSPVSPRRSRGKTGPRASQWIHRGNRGRFSARRINKLTRPGVFGNTKGKPTIRQISNKTNVLSSLGIEPR